MVCSTKGGGEEDEAGAEALEAFAASRSASSPDEVSRSIPRVHDAPPTTHEEPVEVGADLLLGPEIPGAREGDVGASSVRARGRGAWQGLRVCREEHVGSEDRNGRRIDPGRLDSGPPGGERWPTNARAPGAGHGQLSDEEGSRRRRGRDLRLWRS